MPEFLKVKSPDEVMVIIEGFHPLDAEMVELDRSCGRVLAAPVFAPEPVPHFPRSTMDGYAVRARDTFGGSETLPALLEVTGEVLMGEVASSRVEPGKAVSVPTGGMLPEGADAVVMVEYTSPLDDVTLEVTRPVAPGENVLREGEDIAEGEQLFPSGWMVRPQDAGALAALGVGSVSVHRQPRVALISTGDEIVPVETHRLPGGKIRDINNYTLTAQIRAAGGIVTSKAIVPDNPDLLGSACREALAENDMVIVSGGSSVGARDYTIEVLGHFPEAELLAHGIAIRPGKPTILARMGKRILWGLPGQPVSAMMIFTTFVRPSLLRLQGWREAARKGSRSCRAVLSRQLPSVHGRTDCIPVVVSESDGVVRAMPLFGKSAMISILTRSDGYVVIPEHVEGLDEGTEVTVRLFHSE